MSILTRTRLNGHLWAAADILRGSIDSSDYKNYIFGFLFLKRLSDRFEEEAETLIAEGEDEDVAWTDPDEHQFFVPKRARWDAISKLTKDIGNALNKACSALEEANPTLEGVLLNIDFNDSRKLGDGKQRDSILHRLVGHFAQIRLRNTDLEEPDMLGRAYEFLIERFADDAGKKGGEFYTPQRVVELITKLLDPDKEMRICDPTCGSGGMLIQCAEHVAARQGRRIGTDPIDITLHGQEKNLGTWAICKMNLLLHGLPDARIEKGDTIREPKLVHGGELMLYDRVIANPPFSLDKWGAEMAAEDPFQRFHYGLPPKNMGDYAFVQHMVATLSAKGMVGVVMPLGVLFRGSGDGDIRKGLVDDDLFEAIIGLPENLFYGTGIPAAILILNRDKPRKRRGRILFIHAAEGFEARSNQNVLRPEDVERIVKAFRAYKDEDRFSRVVPLDEVKENDYNLNISRYVDTLEPEEPIDVEAALAALAKAEAERDAAAKRMDKVLRELGYGR
ncbi:MAG: type I restriction endonuclease subunit M [Deltaproteobacteria bacterium RIFOXYA12_FULL_61_11]|nr:MAG: type I restriction endonuclease subunit M [Deltaproteobacteria bacterium RIFOXYA12_FULL_61_11]